MSDDTQTVVVNRGFGGFSLHDDTVRWMRERGCSLAEDMVLPGEAYDDGSVRDVDGFRDSCYPRESAVRVCPHLIEAVRENVTRDLALAEVPAGVDWVITEYDGAETLREKHRTFPSGEYASGVASSDDFDSVRCVDE